MRLFCLFQEHDAVQDFLDIDTNFSRSSQATSPDEAPADMQFIQWKSSTDLSSRVTTSPTTIRKQKEIESADDSTDLTSRVTCSPPTIRRRKKKVTESAEDALSVVVKELKSLQEEPKLDSIDQFSKFIASSLREMTAEQRDICTALCFECVRKGKRDALTLDHQIVAVAGLSQFST